MISDYVYSHQRAHTPIIFTVAQVEPALLTSTGVAGKFGGDGIISSVPGD
jgi:hypothetical protein